MTVGVRPNIAVAKASGVPCDKGILVNAHMQTETANVYAIGECVQFEQTTFGLVAPVYDQAAVLVATLLGQNSTFKVAPTATKLKVSGVDLFSAGDISEQPHYQYIEYHDPANHIYKRISLHNNMVVGSVMYGDVADGAWMFDLIGQQSDVSNIRQQLMFGAHFCQ
jgi:nitrite reductase (NADH) large subunit